MVMGVVVVGVGGSSVVVVVAVVREGIDDDERGLLEASGKGVLLLLLLLRMVSTGRSELVGLTNEPLFDADNDNEEEDDDNDPSLDVADSGGVAVLVAIDGSCNVCISASSAGVTGVVWRVEGLLSPSPSMIPPNGATQSSTKPFEYNTIAKRGTGGGGGADR